MIKDLTLTNFRSHEDSKLEFSPHVNIIVGQSDSGKSNLIRALNWIIRNRPLGENVIQYGTNQTLAQIILERNKELFGITRMKQKNRNEYILTSKEEDASFSSFGSSPPEPILEALNLSDINLQKQNEQFFLVFDSPGQVATYIRFITKLDEVDGVVKLLASKIREEKKNTVDYQSDLEEIEEELTILEGIDLERLERKIDETHTLVTLKKNLERKQRDLLRLIVEFEEIEKNIIVLPSNISQIFEEIDGVVNSYQKSYDKQRSFSTLINELEVIVQQEFIFPENLEIISTVNITIQEYNNIRRSSNDLFNIIEKLKLVLKGVDHDSKKMNIVVKEEKVLMNQLEVCPFCGEILTKESKSHLLEEGK